MHEQSVGMVEELIKYVPMVEAFPVMSGPIYKPACSRWTDPCVQNNNSLKEKEICKGIYDIYFWERR